MGFSKTGSSHPPYFWAQNHPRPRTLIIAADFKIRRRWDYYGSNWACEDFRLVLLCWCLGGRLLTGGCNSWSNWTHQRSFGAKPHQTLPNWPSLQSGNTASIWPIRNVWRVGRHFFVQDGGPNNGSRRWDEKDFWLVFWLCENPVYEHSWEAGWRLHVLFMPSFEIPSGLLMLMN